MSIQMQEFTSADRDHVSMLATSGMDYASFALMTACILAAVIGILSVFLIAFFCYMEAEDVPTEINDTEIMSRLPSPMAGCSHTTSNSQLLACTAV